MKPLKARNCLLLVPLSLSVLLLSFYSDRTVENRDFTFPALSDFPKMPTARKNRVTEKGVELGRYLFYDPILSRDSTVACASCHKQENAFGYSIDYGLVKRGYAKTDTRLLGSRNVMPLFNLAWSSRFFWDGRAKSIEEQAYHPVRNHVEMNSDWRLVEARINRSAFYKDKFEAVFGRRKKIDSVMITKAIAQFERTLLSYNSKFDRALRNEESLSDEEKEGYRLMQDSAKGNCFSCHTTGVSNLKAELAFSNNGLNSESDMIILRDRGLGEITKKPADNGKFKIPSLRNLAFTGPYMHDGRFNNLDFVLGFYSGLVKPGPGVDKRLTYAHRGGAKLSGPERHQIITFLHTLNDTSFIKNRAFSNPFKAVR